MARPCKVKCRPPACVSVGGWNNPVICFKCKGTGHYAYACPRKTNNMLVKCFPGEVPKILYEMIKRERLTAKGIFKLAESKPDMKLWQKLLEWDLKHFSNQEARKAIMKVIESYDSAFDEMNELEEELKLNQIKKELKQKVVRKAYAKALEKEIKDEAKQEAATKNNEKQAELEEGEQLAPEEVTKVSEVIEKKIIEIPKSIKNFNSIEEVAQLCEPVYTKWQEEVDQMESDLSTLSESINNMVKSVEPTNTRIWELQGKLSNYNYMEPKVNQRYKELDSKFFLNSKEKAEFNQIKSDLTKLPQVKSQINNAIAELKSEVETQNEIIRLNQEQIDKLKLDIAELQDENALDELILGATVALITGFDVDDPLFQLANEGQDVIIREEKVKNGCEHNTHLYQSCF